MPRNYEYLPIHQGKFKFIAPAVYRVSKSEPAFIVAGNWPEVESFKKAYFKKNRRMPFIKYEVESWGTIKNFVSQGLGIGLVPDYHLLKNDKTVKEFKFQIDMIEYQILAIFMKGTYLSEGSFKLVELFTKFIHDDKV
jgi:DNA-binding transcriptional LysR family regulator